MSKRQVICAVSVALNGLFLVGAAWYHVLVGLPSGFSVVAGVHAFLVFISLMGAVE